MIRLRGCLVLALLALSIPRPAYAQSGPLSGLLVRLLVQSVSMPSSVGVPGNPHEAHFLPSLAQDLAPFEINKAIVGQLGTFPTGSGSSGFSFTFNPATGLFNRTSQGFGPGFAERALTNGKGRIGF